MDGIAATRALRAMGIRHVIIALTANAMAEQQSDFLDAGANVVLCKPIELGALHNALASFVSSEVTSRASLRAGALPTLESLESH